jgi:hypothetical protein
VDHACDRVHTGKHTTPNALQSRRPEGLTAIDGGQRIPWARGPSWRLRQGGCLCDPVAGLSFFSERCAQSNSLALGGGNLELRFRVVNGRPSCECSWCRCSLSDLSAHLPSVGMSRGSPSNRAWSTQRTVFTLPHRAIPTPVVPAASPSIPAAATRIDGELRGRSLIGHPQIDRPNRSTRVLMLVDSRSGGHHSGA